MKKILILMAIAMLSMNIPEARAQRYVLFCESTIDSTAYRMPIDKQALGSIEDNSLSFVANDMIRLIQEGYLPVVDNRSNNRSNYIAVYLNEVDPIGCDGFSDENLPDLCHIRKDKNIKKFLKQSNIDILGLFEYLGIRYYEKNGKIYSDIDHDKFDKYFFEW